MNVLGSPLTIGTSPSGKTLGAVDIAAGVAAYVSLLHEGSVRNSLTRTLRDKPILSHTLERLRAAATLPVAIACWNDQLEAARQAAGPCGAHVFSIGPRRAISNLDALTAATRWLDGWRSGPLLTTPFDRGFHAPAALEALSKFNREESTIHSLLLIDPAAGLSSPELITSLLSHAHQLGEDGPDLVFHPTAPGLSGAIVRKPLLERLGRTALHPGKLLHYFPDHYGRDLLSEPACAPHPIPAARTLESFLLDTSSRVERAESRGACDHASVDDLVADYNADSSLPYLPKELRLELATQRNTQPLFRPKANHRDELAASDYFGWLDELAQNDGSTRLILGGSGGGGDPLLYPHLLPLLEAIKARGLAFAIETDLVGIPADTLSAVADSGVDLLLFHIPAATRETYAKLMGVDAIDDLIGNLNHYLTARGQRGAGFAIPIFTKTVANLPEMENWYDHWLRTLGTAVIDGAHSHAGLIADLSPTNLAPPQRVACRRLAHRMTILADGRVAACEFDAVGSLRATTLRESWKLLNPLRLQHSTRSLPQLCVGCTEWHRP